MRVAYYALVVFLGVSFLLLQYRLWLGKGSMRDVQALEQKISLQKKENATLKARNDALLAQVKELKRGLEAYDERARQEFGMIGEGESFFQVIRAHDR